MAKLTYDSARIEFNQKGGVEIHADGGVSTSAIEKVDYHFYLGENNKDSYYVTFHTRSQSEYTVKDANLEFLNRYEHVPPAFQDLKSTYDTNKHTTVRIPEKTPLEQKTEEGLKRNKISYFDNHYIGYSQDDRIAFVNRQYDNFESIKVDNMKLFKNENEYDLVLVSGEKKYAAFNMQKSDLDAIASTVPGKDQVMRDFYTYEHEKKLENVSKIQNTNHSPTLDKGFGR